MVFFKLVTSGNSFLTKKVRINPKIKTKTQMGVFIKIKFNLNDLEVVV